MITIGLLALALLGPGCSSSKKPKPLEGNQKINQWLTEQHVLLPERPYELQPPDQIKIIAPNIKELDQQEHIIRPDGRITLALFGDVLAAGKTTDQLARDLRELASTMYTAKAIDIEVQVVEYKSKVIYVFGQVDAPGVKAFTGRDTLVAVLAAARLNDDAWPQKVVVVRPDDSPSVKHKITVDLKHMFETGELAQNYLLEDGDLIYVPPSPLAQVNATFKKVVTPLVPSLNLLTLVGGL
jgi:protein involved in polysaccharide export with SLBB domain